MLKYLGHPSARGQTILQNTISHFIIIWQILFSIQYSLSIHAPTSSMLERSNQSPDLNLHSSFRNRLADTIRA